MTVAIVVPPKCHVLLYICLIVRKHKTPSIYANFTTSLAFTLSKPKAVLCYVFLFGLSL